MNVLLITSVVLQFLAFLWAIRLTWRERDWRFGLLALAMGIIAVRRLLIITSYSSLTITGQSPISEISGLLLGGSTLAAIIALDRTLIERRRAEEQLKVSHQQLRELAAQLNSVREEERTAISRDIQDEIGQVLAGLKIEIKLFGKEIQPTHPHLFQRVQEMLSLTDRTLLVMRNIATELRPSVLDNLGLVAAIEWQAEGFQKRSGIACYIHTDFDDKCLSSSLATAIFRIFQESLNNVLQHSEATEVEVLLSQDKQVLLMTVHDNGKGISAAAINKPNSLGILGMRERALPFSGKVDIRNASEGGTIVSLSIPLDHQDSLTSSRV